MEKLKEEINQKNNFLNIELRKLLDKINSKVSRTTSRSMIFYKELLGININDLENQKILNVGAGNSELNQELEKNGIEPSIFVNTDLKAKSGVKSDMRNLPFSEESFDKLLYLWSLPWILYKEDKTKAINEALKATKEGLDINIYPVVLSSDIIKIMENFKYIELEEIDLKNIFNQIDEKSIKNLISQYELLGVDLYYKYSNKIKNKKTVRIKITKNCNNIEEIEYLLKIIKSGEIII